MTGKTKHFLSIKKLNSITNNYTNFPLSLQWGRTGENQSTPFNSAFLDILDGNSNSSHLKNQTLSLQKCFQKGFKMLQKRNSYFKMLLKCFKIDSKMQLDSSNVSKMRLYFQHASNKGQTITIKCFILFLRQQSPISQLTQKKL